MRTERQKKMYGVLAALVVVVFLGVQFALYSTFKKTSDELGAVTGNVATLEKTVQGQVALLGEYKVLEELVPSSRERPMNALELYSEVDRALNNSAVDHTNRSSSSGEGPGGLLEIQVDFNGPYYGLLKALASMRASKYLMKVSTFNLQGIAGGKISGSITVLSQANS